MFGIVISTKWKKTFRDIKERKFQFLALILVLMIGGGMFFSFNTISQWREDSLESIYCDLNWEDLQIDISQQVKSQQEVADILDNSNVANNIEAVEYRLSMTFPLNISTNDKEFDIIQCKLIGINVTRIREATSNNHPAINDLYLHTGRYFSCEDNRSQVGIIDNRFLDNSDATIGDNVTILTPFTSEEIQLIGSATLPEYLVLLDDSPTGGLFSNNQFTVMAVPLSTVQSFLLTPHHINQILIKVNPATDLTALKHELDHEFNKAGIETTIVTGTEHPVYELQWEDAKNDRELFNLIAILFLFAGILGTYMAVNRLTQSQRQQIGIAKAVGYKSKHVIFQYLRFALVLGLLGGFSSLLFGRWFADYSWDLLLGFFNFPIQTISEPYQLYSSVFVLIMSLPILTGFLATYSISRTRPLHLIRFDPSISIKGSTSLFEKLFGKLYRFSVHTKISLRNLFRNKKRTLSTISGIIISICLLFAVWGIYDSLVYTTDNAAEEMGIWDIKLESSFFTNITTWQDHFEEVHGINEINYLVQSPIKYSGNVDLEESERGFFLEGLESESTLRRYEVQTGTLPTKKGIVISQDLANRLNLELGDDFKLEHYYLSGQSSIGFKNTSLTVAGLHNQVFTNSVFVNLETAQEMFNASGMINGAFLDIDLEITTEQDIAQMLFTELPNLRKVISQQGAVDDIKSFINDFRELLLIAIVFSMALAFGLTYTLIYSNIQERKREIGTLKTLGTSSLTVLRFIFIENVLLMLLGTLSGIGIGMVVIEYLIQGPINEFFPQLKVIPNLYPVSLIMMITALTVVILVAMVSVVSLLRNLDLVAATKVRE